MKFKLGIILAGLSVCTVGFAKQNEMYRAGGNDKYKIVNTQPTNDVVTLDKWDFNIGDSVTVTNGVTSTSSGDDFFTVKADDGSVVATLPQGSRGTFLCTQSPCDTEDDWTGLTPIVSDWTFYSPTDGATNTTYTGKYRRVGDSIEVSLGYAWTAAPGSWPATAVPNSLTIDTAKISQTGSYTNNLGEGTVYDSAGAAQPLHIYYNNSTTLTITYEAATSNQISPVSISAPYTLGNGDRAAIRYQVPISGWSSSRD